MDGKRRSQYNVAGYYGTMNNLLFLLLGTGVGIISGLIGLGGGIFFIPALTLLFGMSQHKAQGTSLGALLPPIGLLAFLEYHKAGNVDVRAAVLISIGFLLGGYFGGKWAQAVPELILRRGFAVVLIAVGIRILVQQR